MSCKLRLFFIALLAVSSLLSYARPSMAQGESGAVRVYFRSQEDLEQLARRLDLWEVHREAGYVVAYVTPTDRAWLSERRFVVGEEPAPRYHLETIPGYSCYRTVEEIEAQLDAWASRYPEIARLSTIGYSYEERPLTVVHLTNRSTSGEKPRFFLMANIHGRELITNELALQFIAYLLENYGSDPDVTWLLDEHEIDVLVSANPDGHVRNERGRPWAYWRKNANPTNGACDYSSSYHHGIDLNRNSSYKWGNAGIHPCSETYQGPSAASESETQAVQEFMLSIFEDQRGPRNSDAAPDDATGVFITLHSYSNLVLWPWGHSYSAAPNAHQLEALGRKLASFNGYTPQSSSALYLTTGSTDDWAYGELGVASFTFEVGSTSDGFYPLCSRYDALIQPNLDALLYAAKVARTPYVTALGPDVQAVRVENAPLLQGRPSLIRATVDDEDNGGQYVVGAELYVDVPPWDGGTPYPLAAADGAFDSPVEEVAGELPPAALKAGRHLLYVRGRDAGGVWGPLSAAFVDVYLSPPSQSRMGRPGSTLEYRLTLANWGDVTQTFTLTQRSSAWRTTLTPTQLSLAAGITSPLTVTVSIPEEGSLLLKAPNLVTVTAAFASGSSSAWVRTTLVTGELFLPVVLRGF